MNPSCPLCDSTDTDFYHDDGTRTYQRCSRCSLVFVPPEYYLERSDEKERYDLHENDPDDEGYRSFLSRLTDPLLERLKPHSSGLDFGAGPGPALADMMEEHGHKVELYDLYYANRTEVFDQKYDFITATEVVEHLAKPRDELERLWSCLNEGGYLGIMTKLVLNREAFANWHYIRDDTHIIFFSRPTFHWLAQELNAKLSIIGSDVILLQK